jgi:tetratricopeptide (TPR) repeat protein
LEIDPNNIEALTQLAHYYKNHWRYDATPLWKKVIELEPDNTEAREELAQSYINKALPQKRQRGFFWRRGSSYKQKIKILQEGLEVLPDHPDLIVALGIVYMDARKKKQAKEQFLRAYQIASQDTYVASAVLQNFIHLKENKLIEEMIPEIRTIPDLLPGFWVDQGKTALDHKFWAQRFFDEALEQLNYTDKATKASVLVDIYMCIPPGQHQDLKNVYMQKIEQEVPHSGALEYIEGFLVFSQTHNVNKARRLIRKAKKLATAANDSGMLQHIEMGEQILSISPRDFMDMLFGMEEMIEEMGGFDDGDFF